MPQCIKKSKDDFFQMQRQLNNQIIKLFDSFVFDFMIFLRGLMTAAVSFKKPGGLCVLTLSIQGAKVL